MIGSYAVTAQDWLWLLRAVAAEGPPETEVARALVNLHAWVRSRGGRQSLASLVRAYAQPVNPAWAHGGERDLDHSEVSAKERRRAASAQADSFSPKVVNAVMQALTTSWRSDVTDYAAPWVDARSKGYEPRSEPRDGVNRLWARAPGWRGYEVVPMNVDEKVAAVLSVAKGLPAAERVVVEAALDKALARYRQGPASVGNALLDGVKVIRPGEPGFEEAKQRALSQTEWDLAFANWLDRVYGTVAERTKELGSSAVKAVAGSPIVWVGAFLLLGWWLSKE